MSVTLEQIWATDAQQLAPILATQSRKPTENVNFDRALVALIYHNSGDLKDERVAHPEFAQVMAAAPDLATGLEVMAHPAFERVMAAAPDLATGLKILAKRDVAIKILTLCATMQSAAMAATRAISNDGTRDFIARPVRAAILGDEKLAPASQYNPHNAYGPSYTPYSPYNVASTEVADYTAGEYIAARISGAGSGVSHPKGHTATQVAIEQHVGDLSLQPYRVMNPHDPLVQAIADAAFRTKLSNDAENVAFVATQNTDDEFDPIQVVSNLMNSIDVAPMVPISRCFYLWSLQDILSVIPETEGRQQLIEQVNVLTAKYGCSGISAEVTDTITAATLSPLLGGIGAAGGADMIAALTRGYTARPPSREEAVARLLAMPMTQSMVGSVLPAAARFEPSIPAAVPSGQIGWLRTTDSLVSQLPSSFLPR